MSTSMTIEKPRFSRPSITSILSLLLAGAIAVKVGAKSITSAAEVPSSRFSEPMRFTSADNVADMTGKDRITTDRGQQDLEFDRNFTTREQQDLEVGLYFEHYNYPKTQRKNHLRWTDLKNISTTQRYLSPQAADLSKYFAIPISHKDRPISAIAFLPQISNVITASNFVGVAENYPTKGGVSLVEERGRKYLQFDETFSTNQNLDLTVLLYRNDGVSTKIKLKEYVKLSPLKSFNGKQRYLIPEDIDVKKYTSVVLWCEKLNLPFGYATF